MLTEKIPLRASEWSRAEARLESDRKRDVQRATFSGIAAGRRRPHFDPIGRP